MSDDTTYYWNKLDDKNSWKAFVDAMKNDSLPNAKELLDRMKLHAGTHERVQILEQIYNERNNAHTEK
jgi:hypothetical protein